MSYNYKKMYKTTSLINVNSKKPFKELKFNIKNGKIDRVQFEIVI